MVYKILVVNVPNPLNRGGMAIVIGAINSIIKNIPDAEITLQSTRPKSDSIFYNNLPRTEISEHIWYKECDSNIATALYSGIKGIRVLCIFSLSKLSKKLGMRCKNPYQQYNLIVDLNSDALNDHYGIVMPIYSLFNTFIALLSDKPVVICGASVGVFKRRTSRVLASSILNRVKLITVREGMSLNYLKSIGVNKPKIYLTADHAFLMEPTSSETLDRILEKEKISNEEPLIGVAASNLIYRYAFPECKSNDEKYKKYIGLMVYLIDYLIENYNVTVLLISHVSATGEDDYVVSKDIYLKSKNRDKLKLISNTYRAEEYKGLIGLCSMFIGCRMHPTIASTSMCVPTIALTYGHKFQGIIGDMLGQKDSIIDITDANYDDLEKSAISTVKSVYANRDTIKDSLCERSTSVKERALLNGKYIKELLLNPS